MEGKLGSTRGSAGEVGAISRLKTEDDKFRVLIENSRMFLYEVLRNLKVVWIVLPSSMAVARAVAAANQVALDQGAGHVKGWISSKAERKWTRRA